jgi:penicillin-binding protein-related factor A (putative recombinase)
MNKLPSTAWLRGKKANKVGKDFEQVIINYCHREGMAVKKTDAPMRQAGGKIWRERAGVDFVLGFQGVAVFLDAKSVDSDRISFSFLKPHQLQDLSYWQSNGFTSGLLVYFRQINMISFIPICDLLKLSPGQSIKAEQTTNLGSYFDFQLGRLFSMEWETKRCLKCKKIL